MTIDSSVIWPDISNPIARRIVYAAYQACAIEAEDKDYDPITMYSSDAAKRCKDRTARGLREHKHNRREQLLRSDLAVRMLDHSLHEAFYETLSSNLAWWFRAQRPRTIEQLVCHVGRQLAWYLNPEHNPSCSELEKPHIHYVIIVVSGISLSYFAALLNFHPIFVAFAILLLIVLAFMSQLHAFLKSRANMMLNMIDRSEFYLYLREAYRDVEQ